MSLDEILAGKRTWWVEQGDCRTLLRTLPDACIDAVITDPPYPEVNRPYGQWTAEEWFVLMDEVVSACRRVLKPSRSAVFILQPNSEHVGTLRPWLWEFLAKWCRQWNQIQDVWWWNFTTAPTVHCQRKYGLLRPSVKVCAWFGSPDCYRDQDGVLWFESAAMAAKDRSDRALRRRPSGQSMRAGRCGATVDERGGTTPFNLLPLANTDSHSSAGASGHGAGTPLDLCRWWARYICPDDGLILDPFCGTGTTGIAARETCRRFLGIETITDYVTVAHQRVGAVTPLLDATVTPAPVTLAPSLFDEDEAFARLARDDQGKAGEP
jgi:DNA modification methylase